MCLMLCVLFPQVNVAYRQVKRFKATHVFKYEIFITLYYQNMFYPYIVRFYVHSHTQFQKTSMILFN